MKIVIGNYTDPTDSRNLILNDEVTLTSDTSAPTSVLFALISKVDGIETAPFRNGTGEWSGADGGYLSSQLYSARTITISGTYIDRRAGCDFSAQATAQFDHIARLYMRSRLPIRTKQYIRIFMDSGMTFYTEGYCTDIQMEYTFVGHGDYQISLYCPDPALYRGDLDGTIGSEWNLSTIRKHNDVGFVSSGYDSLGDPQYYYAGMEQGASGTFGIFIPNHAYAEDEQIIRRINDESKILAAKTSFTSGATFDISDWDDTGDVGENHGIVWKTGGRANAIVYNGDLPYYPQFIVEPRAGKHIVNPQFISLTEDKTFGLGYPESSIAKFKVTAVDSAGGITTLAIDETGGYDSDFSGSYPLMNYSGNSGSGATVTLTMAKNADDLWYVTSATKYGSDAHWGTQYQVNDILIASIPGASILVISHGMKCVVDMAEHTATVNGNSVAYYITPGSEWFDLQALKTNNLLFSSALNDDDDTIQVRWRNGYQGI